MVQEMNMMQTTLPRKARLASVAKQAVKITVSILGAFVTSKFSVVTCFTSQASRVCCFLIIWCCSRQCHILHAVYVHLFYIWLVVVIMVKLTDEKRPLPGKWCESIFCIQLCRWYIYCICISNKRLDFPFPLVSIQHLLSHCSQ